MRYIVYILIVGALIGSYFNILPGLTWSDVTSIPLLVISVLKYIQKKWKVDAFCRLSALYLPFMLISATVNADITNTIFINYFRNYFYGILVYFALSNSIRSIKDVKRFMLFASVYLVVFLLNFRSMAINTQYYTLDTLDFGYGRNNVAFTALLMAIVFEFLYYSKIVKAYILVGVVLMAFIILFCASRYAMIMLLVSFVLFRVFYKKISLYEILTLTGLALISIYIFRHLTSTIDSSFVEYSQNYLKDKVNGAGQDFFSTRIMSINVIPISETFSTGNILVNLIFGKPLAIQHSFFSHTLITTGILGFMCYIITHLKQLVLAYKYKGIYFFLFIVVLVMFINDFITDATFIVGVNSMLYGAICAVLYNFIKINENANISK